MTALSIRLAFQGEEQDEVLGQYFVLCEQTPMTKAGCPVSSLLQNLGVFGQTAMNDFPK